MNAISKKPVIIQGRRKWYLAAFLISISVLTVGFWRFFLPREVQINGSDSKHFTTMNQLEIEDGDKDRPTDESKGDDDSVVWKKKQYLIRAYPAQTIPAGAREKAWEQFQKLYKPGQKKSSWKSVSGGVNDR